MTDEDRDEWAREDSERLAEEIRPILVQVALLDRDDLERAREELQRFEAAGPIVNPTAYMEQGDANSKAKDRLDAVIEFYDAVDAGDLMEAGP